MNRSIAALLVTAAFAVGSALAQDPPGTSRGGPNPRYDGPKVPNAPGPGLKPPVLTPPADVVMVESLVSEPAVIPHGARQVKLWLTVKNVSNSGGGPGFAVNGVKMGIYRTNPGPEILEMGTTVVNLAPGQTQRVGQLVNVAPGERTYAGRVDKPENSLHESASAFANNEKLLTITIRK
jgi:hypothetical protein